MMGRINIHIPPDSREWLFADDNDRRPDAGRLWSLGRFPPKCRPGDDIFFRFDGEVVAAAVVEDVYLPGLLDGVCHNGQRYLRGYKVTWLNSAFVDLRECRVTVQVASNDRHGRDVGKFDNAQLAIGLPGFDPIDLEGGEMSVRWLGNRRAFDGVRLGRRSYSIRNYGSHVGNLCWDSFEVGLFDGAAILNQLLDADFGITCGPPALHDRQFTTEPITWRELLATAAEVE